MKNYSHRTRTLVTGVAGHDVIYLNNFFTGTKDNIL